MSILADKWNEDNWLKEESEIVPHPAGIIAGNDPLPGAKCSERQLRKTSGKVNRAKTERNEKGEDFVWRPGLEGLEYLTIFILPIFFTRQYLDGAGKAPVRLLMQTPE